MKYKVLATENIFKNKFFDIEQVDLEIDCYDGNTKKIHRIALKRPAVAAVLLQVEDTEELVEQFRYSATRTGDAFGNYCRFIYILKKQLIIAHYNEVIVERITFFFLHKVD